MQYFDKTGKKLFLNDYVKVITKDIGTHNGYIRSFNRNKIKVGCLVGELYVSMDKVIKL